MDGREVYYAWARFLRDTPDEASQVPERVVPMPADMTQADLVGGSLVMIRRLALALAETWNCTVQDVGSAVGSIDPEAQFEQPALRLIRGDDSAPST